MIDVREIDVFEYKGNDTYNFIALLDVWESLEVTYNFNSWDEFQLNVPYRLDQAYYYRANNVLRIADEYFYITSVQVDKIESGFVVKGRSLFGHISDRMIMSESTNYYNKYPEDIITTMLNNEMINPSDAKRKMLQLSLSATPRITSIPITMQQGLGQLDDVVTKLMATYDIGVKEVAQPYTGNKIRQTVTLTGGVTNPTVEISTDLQNLIDPSFKDDQRDQKTFALVAGEGDFPNRVKQIIGDSYADVDRKEIYVDARDLQKTSDNVTMSDTDYAKALVERGNNKLSEKERLLTLSGDIDLQSHLFVLGKDFNIGDNVIIKSSEFMMSKVSQITTITYTFDTKGRHVELKFDHDKYTQFTITK